MEGTVFQAEAEAGPRIFQVAPANISAVWSQCAELIADRVAEIPTHSLEDIRGSLLGQKSQLWIQWDKPVVAACLITEFASYPRGVWVRVWEAGARDGYPMDMRGFFEQLEHWRKMHGCRGFECCGRHGWARRFPRATVEGVLMRITTT